MEEKTILCPHCNEELNVEEQQLDSEMECPHCWKKINGSTPQDLESDTSLNEDEPDPGYADEEIKISPKEFWLKTPLISLLIFGAFVIVAKILNEIRRSDGWHSYRPYEDHAQVIFVIGIVAALLYFIVRYICYKVRSIKRQTKREFVAEYFAVYCSDTIGIQLREKVLSFLDCYIPMAKIITAIIRKISEKKIKKFCRFREPLYDELQEIDIDYLENLNVLPRFGKNESQLVSPMQTLFCPAFDGVEDLRDFCSVVSEEDSVCRYELEKVTKVYTFEDQLFIYTGIWSYAIGKMISETTEAFFFKDITDMKTESVFKIHTEYERKGCLSIFIPWAGKPIETVYKESESFIITSTSGNSVGLNIGFGDYVAVNGRSYTRRNENEKLIHAIRKMIEEKKAAVNE